MVTGAVAVSGPAGVATVATTAPLPTRPDAVYVVVGPLAGASAPGVPGARVHAAEMDGIGFPKPSMPTALKDAVLPSGTVTVDGSMRIATATAPDTVSAWVAETAPGALTLRVAVPAVVSW